MALIELRGITKEYRNDTVVTPALTGIDLTVQAGEFIAVMGASGSGKTTLLHILGCMDRPTSGEYLYRGEHLEQAQERRLASIRGREIAFVFQNFGLIEDYTVFENAELPLLRRRMPGARRRQEVMEALDRVGIAGLAQKRPSHLSGGQRQRAAIARALACGADTVLADEPTGALDSRTGQEILELFSELNRQGKTVVLITHDPRTAYWAKRLILIEDGRILKDETDEKNHGSGAGQPDCGTADRLRKTQRADAAPGV